MLIYNFNERKNLSKYEYLYQCLRSDILNGTLTEGMKMPSKRALSIANHVSLTTVISAYEQLLMEGYLVSKERSGYYVASNFIQTLRYQDVAITPPGPEFEEDWKADFASNSIIYERFPFSTWTKVMRQVLSDYHVELMKRGDFLGSKELRMEIAKYLSRNRGMIVSPDCIIIGTGIEYLYSKLIRLLPSNSVYTMENPGYRKIPLIYDELGVHWVRTDMDDEGIKMDDLLRSGASVVHTSPEHHYPLGIVMSARRRQQLLKWLEDSPERYIIEDDYDWEFRYQGRPIPALYGMDYTNRVIYMNTFSKTLSPAIRISYMILPKALINKYISTANFFSNTSSNLEQYTLARFIKDGYFDRHLNRTRKYYSQHGELLVSIINNTPGFPVKEIYSVESGTHILVKLKTKMSDEEIKAKAREIGINVCCLSEFCIGNSDNYQHTLVLNYSSMSEETMRENIKLLGEIIH